METLRRFAWVVGLLGFFAFVTFFSLWYLFDPLKGWMQGVGFGAAGLLVLYLVLDREQVGAAMQTRSFVYGSGSSLSLVVAAAIAVLCFGLSERYDERWDMTGKGRFTLSAETLSTAAALTAPVDVLAFFPRGSSEEAGFREITDGISLDSDNLRVQFVDPLRQPMVAEQYAITSRVGTVVLQQGDNRQRLESDFSEAAFTKALAQLTAGVEHTLCWSTGHGEADPDDDYQGKGFGVIVQKLEDRNNTVKKVRVLSEGVPKDCDALIVVDGLVPWLPVELESIAAYVAGGGSALWLLEPHFSGETQGDLLSDLPRYGVVVGSDVVIETDSFYLIAEEDLTTILLYGDELPSHPITDPLQAAVVLGMARSVSPLETAATKTTVLAQTSVQSWAETDMKSMPPRPDQGVDALIGSVPVAVAIEVIDASALAVAKSTAKPAVQAPTEEPVVPAEGEDDVPAAEGDEASEPAPVADAPALGDENLAEVGRARGAGVPADFVPKDGGRMVVIGDMNFAANELVANGNNQDLFLNSIAWLIADEAQLTQRPDMEPETLDISNLGVVANWLISLFLIPGAAVFFAIVVVVRRSFM